MMGLSFLFVSEHGESLFHATLSCGFAFGFRDPLYVFALACVGQ